MKEIILNALNELSANIKQNIPSTTQNTIDVDITNVYPVDLLSFMNENNIPLDAKFCTIYDDIYEEDSSASLRYKVEVDMTDEDKRNHYKWKFHKNYNAKIVNALLTNGYEKRGTISFFDLKPKEILKAYESNQIEHIVNIYKKGYSKI